MSSWVSEQRLDRSGNVIEQTVVVDLDPDDVLALLPKLENPTRYVSVTVKFDQIRVEGEYSYRPAVARAYMTVGEAR